MKHHGIRPFAMLATFILAAGGAGCAGSSDGSVAGGAGPEFGVAADSAAQGAAPQPVTPAQPGGGQAIVENGWVAVADEPVSTFSSDVDTASYTMVRYLLNTRQWYSGMEAEARIEEMVNYFDYGYEAPAEDSERPFNVDVKVAAAPWDPTHQLARIGVKAKEARPNTEGNNIVFLLDTSGSMGDDNKLPLLVESFKLLAEQFDSRDKVSVITYAGSSSVLLDGVDGSETSRIIRTLESLESGGSTAGSDALAKSYELAAEHFIEGGNNRILLATDGDFNVGPSSVDELKSQITEAREKGVFISVLGFGMFSHDALMETIADNGNGNYFYIDSLKEAQRALVDQFDSTMFTVAKDLKIQVAFNPAAVAEYRLIGYENRMLENEDFADDAVDAGDVGAGATVTALYELVPGNAESGGGAEGSWMTVSTRYKDADGDESKQDDFEVPQDQPDVAADEDWRFAAAVAEFGMILRNSPNRGEASIDQVKSLAGDALGADPYGLRAEFLDLVAVYGNLIP
jgi:Ca-activated chloride channel family protein